MPARAPASIDMLQTVSRPSIDMRSNTDPAYSITWPVPPAAPMRAMMARITSLGVTPGPSAPSTVIRIDFGLRCHSVCVASTCSTSDAPMPKASAPSAPWVAVWLSPQTISRPGCVIPCSGPMMCTIPCRLSPRPNSVNRCAAAFSARAATISRRFGSVIAARSWLCVET